MPWIWRVKRGIRVGMLRRQEREKSNCFIIWKKQCFQCLMNALLRGRRRRSEMCQQPPEARREARHDFSLRASGKKPPWEPQTNEEMSFYCWKPPVLWSFVSLSLILIQALKGREGMGRGKIVPSEGYKGRKREERACCRALSSRHYTTLIYSTALWKSVQMWRLPKTLTRSGLWISSHRRDGEG